MNELRFANVCSCFLGNFQPIRFLVWSAVQRQEEQYYVYDGEFQLCTGYCTLSALNKRKSLYWYSILCCCTDTVQQYSHFRLLSADNVQYTVYCRCTGTVLRLPFIECRQCTQYTATVLRFPFMESILYIILLYTLLYSSTVGYCTCCRYGTVNLLQVQIGTCYRYRLVPAAGTGWYLLQVPICTCCRYCVHTLNLPVCTHRVAEEYCSGTVQQLRGAQTLESKQNQNNNTIKYIYSTIRYLQLVKLIFLSYLSTYIYDLCFTIDNSLMFDSFTVILLDM
jgi:hypothetical protein